MRSCSVALVILAACTAPPSSLAPEPDAAAQPPDAAPPDADVTLLGPSLVLDDFHVASNAEDPHALSLLGTFLNPMLEQQLADGTLLLGLELRDLDDPSGQDDGAIGVGLFSLADSDDDPSDNFDPGQPETFTVADGGFVGDDPAILFDDATIAGGTLAAEGIGALDILTDILPLSIAAPELAGNLIPNGSRDAVVEMTNGRLRGGLPASLFALLPNIAGDMCTGATLLDVIATGCGLIPLQPDLDLDEDGLETFADTDGDGSIDRCVDGDGSEILGTDCPSNPAMADGYRLIFAIHGVRAIVVR